MEEPICEPIRHVCNGSDHMGSIAFRYGFLDWRSLWEMNKSRLHPRMPTLLYKGRALEGEEGADVLEVPPRDQKSLSATVREINTFMVKSALFHLRLRLLDADFRPLARANCTVRLDLPRKAELGATTDDKGQIEFKIPFHAQRALLTVKARDATSRNSPEEIVATWDLHIGALNPILEQAPNLECISGVQQRLNNLGFACGEVTGLMNDATSEALRQFQRAFQQSLPAIRMDVSGRPDAPTQQVLYQVHDKPDSLVRPARDLR